MSTYSEFLRLMPDFTWHHTPEDICLKCQSLIESTSNFIDKIAKTPLSQANFDNVLKPLIQHDMDYDRHRNILHFYSSVSTDKTVRDESTEVGKKFSDFEVQLSMRKDMYELLLAVKNNEQNLDYDTDRLLTRLLLYKKRNGLHLPEDQRAQIEALDKRMNLLCINFSKNLVEEKTTLIFTKNQLDGMPEDFLNGLEKDDADDYKITLQYPHVIPILKHAKVVETRKAVEFAFNRRCIVENTPILEDLIELRYKRSQLLGYKNHADFVTEILMSKNSANIKEFLQSLHKKLIEPGKKQLGRLLELKKEECQLLGLEFDNEIHPYDSSYYQRMVEERDYKVDKIILKDYFPFESVTSKLMELYQTLLHLRFVIVPDAKAWHPEVTLYAVYEKNCTSNIPMGYFYLDLFPREGKYSHAACFGLQDFCMVKEGQHQIPLAAMVANFTKPLANKPSLLTHEEVETYFHEFGHVMHHICSKSKYAMFSGTSVETDFVEAPSQMLENWVWDKESLKFISQNYITGERMPDDLIEKLCKSRTANSALFYLRQLSLATFDQNIHTVSRANTLEVWHKTNFDIVGIKATPDTNMAASFGHMAGGYDSRYYGYLWSEVFSCDMFLSRFKKEGTMNPNTGLSYRKCILEPGGTYDGMDLLKNFLGREPSQEAFLEISGIKDM